MLSNLCFGKYIAYPTAYNVSSKNLQKIIVQNGEKKTAKSVRGLTTPVNSAAPVYKL